MCKDLPNIDHRWHILDAVLPVICAETYVQKSVQTATRIPWKNCEPCEWLWMANTKVSLLLIHIHLCKMVMSGCKMNFQHIMYWKHHLLRTHKSFSHCRTMYLLSWAACYWEMIHYEILLSVEQESHVTAYHDGQRTDPVFSFCSQKPVQRIQNGITPSVQFTHKCHQNTTYWNYYTEKFRKQKSYLFWK